MDVVKILELVRCAGLGGVAHEALNIKKINVVTISIYIKNFSAAGGI